MALFSFLRRGLNRISNQPTDSELLGALSQDTWGLCCAVMAYQRSNGMWFGFDGWWDIAKKNFLPKARRFFPELTEKRLRDFLLAYAREHSHEDAMSMARQTAGIVPHLDVDEEGA